MIQLSIPIALHILYRHNDHRAIGSSTIMNDTLQIIVLSIIQGITEFLPISSSMHLVLWKHWFWPHDPSFDIAVHCGSLFAVMWVFWPEVLRLLRGAADTVQIRTTADARLCQLLVLATIPVIIAGFLLHGEGWEQLHQPTIIGASSLGFGLLLWWADHTRRGQRTVEQWTIPSAVLIGIAQIVALIPGTSRSGVCMTAALTLGFSRREAARLALLMSMPVIAGAGVLESWHLWQTDALALSPSLLLALGCSLVASALSIRLMLWLLDRLGFMPFIMYRCALGLYLLLFV